MVILDDLDTIQEFLESTFGDRCSVDYNWITKTPSPLLFIMEDFILLRPAPLGMAEGTMIIVPLICSRLDVKLNIKNFLDEVNDKIKVRLDDETIPITSISLAISDSAISQSNERSKLEIGTLVDGEFLGTVFKSPTTPGDCYIVEDADDINNVAKNCPTANILVESKNLKYQELTELANEKGFSPLFYRFGPRIEMLN